MDADVRHGTYSGYTHGCRCGMCRAAASDYQRRYRERMLQNPADMSNWHKRWSDVDVAVLTACFGKVPDADLAKFLGRNITAMKRKAWRLKLKKKGTTI